MVQFKHFKKLHKRAKHLKNGGARNSTRKRRTKEEILTDTITPSNSVTEKSVPDSTAKLVPFSQRNYKTIWDM
jgi:hypothetical protein